MCVPGQKCILASLFAFSALLVCILPLCQLWCHCSNMRNDSGHVVWRFDQSASFRIFDSAFTFCIPQFCILSLFPSLSKNLKYKIRQSVVGNVAVDAGFRFLPIYQQWQLAVRVRVRVRFSTDCRSLFYIPSTLKDYFLFHNGWKLLNCNITWKNLAE